MLSAEEQAECLSYLPSFDLVWGSGKAEDPSSTTPKLVDGFFEKNLSLQGDIRTFQVFIPSQIPCLMVLERLERRPVRTLFSSASCHCSPEEVAW